MNEYDSLPVAEVLPELLKVLSQQNSAVLHAPPGAGKTTLVPLSLLLEGYQGIVLIEPRRLAAKSSASRIVFLHGTKIGDIIGYQVRFDSKVSSQTKCICATTGIVLNWLSSDPFISDCNILIFDEFHERSLESDLLLGMARLLQKTVRQDLKILVMSATLDCEKVSEYLGRCPIISSQGKIYPVKVSYSALKTGEMLADAIVTEVTHLMKKIKGDILIFLPGMKEILEAKSKIDSAMLNIEAQILHGELQVTAQEQILRKSDKQRIILSTNVAETSVTINGIEAVVDSGLAKKNLFESRLGLNNLETVRISKASADQRAGRAGRECPGFCVRLWTEKDHLSRESFELPEIARVDLSEALLRLFCLGESNLNEFPWFEKPNPDTVKTGLKLLENLKAIKNGKVTPLGKEISDIPLHPRLAAILLKSVKNGSLKMASLAVAILSEKSVFDYSRDNNFNHSQSFSSSSDILDVVEILKDYESKKNSLSVRKIIHERALNVFKVRNQLISYFNSQPDNSDGEDAFLQSILAGFPDRIARRREKGSSKALLVGNRGILLSRKSLVREPVLFVCIDIQVGDEESVVHMASTANYDWLDPDFLETVRDVSYDQDLKKLVATQKKYYIDLVLEEKISHLNEEDLDGSILAQALIKRLPDVLPPLDSLAGQLIERINLYHQLFPKSGFPVVDSQSVLEPLLYLCKRKKTLAEVLNGDWVNSIRSILSFEQNSALKRELPDQVQLPSGKSVAIKYQVGKSPLLEAKIQDLFGWRETPKLAGGKLSLLISLLAPNYRSQQLTIDLAGFWKNTYPQVRKELRGRYPKHAWPEDPFKTKTEP